MASGTATVKQVLSGDSLILMGASKGGPPPEKTVVLASVMAPRMAMKSQAHESQDEPFAFEAREFLRKRLIGSVVSFAIEFEERGKQHASVIFEGEDMGLAVVEAGLGKVRNSRPPNCAKNIDDLRHAESTAKEAKLGVWTDESGKTEASIRNIQWISGDGPATKAFVNYHKNKELPAIVEFIRDGGCYRVYFPEQSIFATVMLSGVQVDAFKRLEGYEQPQAEPFALEAKFFVEIRLMNRDIKIRVEDSDDYGNILGELIHPNGNIGILLLRNGFAKIQDWGIRVTENPSLLRDAQKEAQQQRIRKWRNWQPPTVEGVKEYQAKVVEVVSGDCVIVVPLDIPDEIEEKRLYLASIRCPRVGNRNRADEPWAYDAKEFVRRKLIGKKVSVTLEYTRDPTVSAGGAPPPPSSDSSGKMHFVSIVTDNNKSNISEQLIFEGLAKTMSHRNDDPRAENFEVLLEKEKQAIEKKKGVHAAPSSAPKHVINDLVGPDNVNKAKSFGESMKRLDRIEGIIDHVFNGGRFKIRIPSQSLALSFCLGGVRCPTTGRQGKPSEEFAEEALQFSRDKFMQRSVSIKVETNDKGGNFIGTMWHGKDCVNVQLVEHGFARLNEMGFAPSAIRNELDAAEKTAREKRSGLWSASNAFESITESTEASNLSVNLTLKAVTVVAVNAVDDFYVQEVGTEAVDLLQEKIQSHVQSTAGVQGLGQGYTQTSMPKVGEIVFAQFSEDKQWYRAKVVAVDRKQMKIEVVYVDFGNSEFVGLKSVLRCSAELHPSKVAALARHCALAGLRPPTDFEAEGADAFEECTAQRAFRCLVECVDPATKKSLVQLYPYKGNAATGGMDVVSVNEDLLARGFAIIAKRGKTDIMETLKEAETKARKAHLNVWRLGDIDGDSDDDRDGPFNGSRRR